MFTIQDYIDSLNRDKESLVANLTTKGVTASDTETFTTLVPKVLDIISVNNQSKSETITSNTTTTITPDTGYTGLSSVEVTTNVEPDMSEYIATTFNDKPLDTIKKLPALTFTGTSLERAFGSWKGLVEAPSITFTNTVTTTRNMFMDCSNLETVPLYDTSNVTNFNQMFASCTKLKNIPAFNTSSVTNFSWMFTNDSQLTDTSLDNILLMAIGATSYTGTKTLASAFNLDWRVAVSSRFTTLPHYQDFLDAGWTLGY